MVPSGRLGRGIGRTWRTTAPTADLGGHGFVLHHPFNRQHHRSLRGWVESSRPEHGQAHRKPQIDQATKRTPSKGAPAGGDHPARVATTFDLDRDRPGAAWGSVRCAAGAPPVRRRWPGGIQRKLRPGPVESPAAVGGPGRRRRAPAAAANNAPNRPPGTRQKAPALAAVVAAPA